MSDDDNKFEEAVLEWKHRHGIRDDDPILASLELFRLFFQNVKIEAGNSDSLNLVELRAALQRLDRLGKDFAKQTRELTNEIRGLPKGSRSGNGGRVVVWVLIAVVFLAAGFFFGRHL